LSGGIVGDIRCKLASVSDTVSAATRASSYMYDLTTSLVRSLLSIVSISGVFIGQVH